MKNFTQVCLLFAALLTASSGTAQTFQKQLSPVSQKLPKSLKVKKAAALRLPVASDEVVNDTPEGKLFENQAYSNTYHYYDYDGNIANDVSDAILINYVLAPDSTIWLHSPISMIESGWIRLDRVNDTDYVAHTPQLVLEDQDDVDDDGNPYKAYATRLVLKNFGDGYYYYPDTVGENQYNLDIKFTYKDGILRQVQNSTVADMSNMPYEVLGLTYADGSWLGYADGNMCVYPINEPVAKVPDGVEPQLYVLTDSTLNATTGKFSITRQLVHMATSGNDAYLAAPDGSGGWIHGTYQDDGSISFKRQYLGPAESYGSHIWFRPATYNIQKFDDNEDEPWGVSFNFTDELVLKPTTDGFAATEPNAIVLNASPNRVLYTADYLVPSLNVFNEVAAIPATPSVVEFYPYDEDNGFSLVTVDVPVVDNNKNLLNTSKLYYVIYYDSAAAPHTFSPNYYEYLSSELTEIPYAYQDNEDFFISEYGHTIYINDDEPNKVGVQSIYRGGNEERRSDIVWSDGSITAGITSPAISSGNRNTAAAYYDLEGRMLKKPVHGLNIVRNADGTVGKVILK